MIPFDKLKAPRQAHDSTSSPTVNRQPLRDHVRYIYFWKSLRNEDLITSPFKCPNLPGFKNLAGLILDFI
jgi:hypothetical protein